MPVPIFGLPISALGAEGSFFAIGQLFHAIEFGLLCQQWRASRVHHIKCNLPKRALFENENDEFTLLTSFAQFLTIEMRHNLF
jgi:hypothetical protein